MASDYTMYSGDSRLQPIGIFDEVGAPVDVSTATDITYKILKATGETVITKTLADGITVDESVVTVELAPADTAELSGPNFIHELQITTSLGAVYTVLQGTIAIKRDYIE